MEPTRELARYVEADICLDDHGIILMSGHFKGQSWNQGFGLEVDNELLKRFMRVWGVEFLTEVNGRPCWVTHTRERILKVEPLMAGEGESFDVAAWCDEKQAAATAQR